MALTAWRRRKIAGKAAAYFGLAALFVTVYAWAYIGEITSRTVEAAFAWIRLEYIGIPFIAPLWLLFITSITGHEKWITRQREWLLMIVPFVTLAMVQTNDWHHLFYADMRMEAAGPLLTFRFTPGNFYWLSQIYDNAGMILSSFLIVRRAFSAQPAFRQQAQVFLAGALLQWAGLAIFISGSSPFNLDLSSLTLSLSSMIFLVGLFRYRALDLLPMARDVIFERMADGVLVLDTRNRLIDFNLAAQNILPELQPGAIGQPVEVLLSAWEVLIAQATTGTPEVVEVESAQHYFQSHITPVTSKQGHTAGKIITLYDVTEVRQLLEKMRELATRDSLTNLFNRHYFLELANREIERASRHQRALSIIALDLDHFKRVNDTYSHAAGDLVLQIAAQVMRSITRKMDICGRLGGEEFWILLPETSLPEALIVAERLRLALEHAEIFFEGQSVKVTGSFGVTSIGLGEKTALDTLIRIADEALYEAKSSGRNCVRSRQG